MGAKSDLESFAFQFIRHAVVVLVDFNVVIDVDTGDLPLGVLVGFVRQCQCVGLIEQRKELAAGLFELAQRSVVQTIQQFAMAALRSAKA